MRSVHLHHGIKKLVVFSAAMLAVMQGMAQPAAKKNTVSAAKTITLTREQLRDKIKGGWAGQTIGVTFGGPYEFRFNGTFIQDYQPLVWYNGYLKETMLNIPGLYDDLYMDLTFVDVFERNGLDAPVDSFANAFANAGYMLWHANQAARYNILNGIKPPLSGHWLNSPHADDIDYQIESDFAGLMSPGMPNTASAISDKIGHIMNYGDGWYGGVFIGAMYTQAFVSKDVNQIVSQALKTIPGKSTFYQCISDVVRWHKQYSNDWHQAWFELQKKWSSDIGCADGVFNAFNIDARINSAYVVLGLLYGGGDFGKSIEIATRAGQDADCNPSSVGGVLGAMLGYDKIPPYWKQGLAEAENIDFKYTTMSLNKVYEVGLKHALQVIRRNGGRVDGDNIIIAMQTPKAVKLEQSFEGLFPVEKKSIGNNNGKEISFEFEGTGFVLKGEARKKNGEAPDYTFEAELYVDGQKVETAKFPTSFTTRRHELFWKYPLPKGKHVVRIKVLNPNEEYVFRPSEYIVYNNQPKQH
jgi:hypothetical protein